MSKRKTRCLTWGEEKKSSYPLVDSSNKVVGRICFSHFVTLCGKDDENVRDAVEMPMSPTRRPAGVCPSCWVQYRSCCFQFQIGLEEA